MLNLTTILSYARRQGTAQHDAFLDLLAAEIAPCEVVKDKAGTIQALIVKIDDTPILYTAHTDTVHNAALCSNPEPTNFYNHDEDMNYFAAGKGAGCLGADDGAGIYVLLKLIEQNHPGTYIFFTGEEVGGVGSTFVAQHMPDFLGQFKIAIAFDRRGCSDVIYEQGVGECASKGMAQTLAEALNAYGMDMKPSNMGIFTDTANLADIIPECLNVAVGYANEHGEAETLDGMHVDALISALSMINPETLLEGVKRVPADYGDTGWNWHKDFYAEPKTKTLKKVKTSAKTSAKAKRTALHEVDSNEVMYMTFEEIQANVVKSLQEFAVQRALGEDGIDVVYGLTDLVMALTDEISNLSAQVEQDQLLGSWGKS